MKHLKPIEAKYKANRHLLKNGDIILFRGSDVIDKAIQIVDKAYFNHIGIISKWGDRVIILDATAGRGVNIDFLSTRIAQEVNFIVKRVITNDLDIKIAVGSVARMGDNHFGYNYGFIAELALKKLFGIKINLSEHHAFICSVFVREYVKMLGLNEPFTTPQDYVRIPCNQLKTIIK